MAALPRAFWSLLISSSGSNLADGIIKLGVPLIAAALTRDPFLVGLVGTAAGLPWLIMALPAGVIVDRVDRRKTLIIANIVRILSLILLVILLALKGLDVWSLGVIVLVMGIAEVFYDTSAQTILPDIVPRASLTRANARLYGAEMTMNSFIGPPLAGVLAAVSLVVMAGAPALLWIGATLFLFGIKGNFTVGGGDAAPEPGVSAAPRQSMWHDLVEGLRYLWSTKVLRTMAIMTGVSNLASNAQFAVFVLFAVGPHSEMKLNSIGYGLLTTGFAIGALLGSFIAEKVVDRIGRTGVIAFALVVFPIQVAVPAFTTSPWIIGVSFLIGGIAVALWNVTAVSLRQEVTPPRLLGRLNSAYRLLAWGSNPVGAFLGGIVASAFGFQAVFLAFGGVCLLLLFLLPNVSKARITELLESRSDAD